MSISNKNQYDLQLGDAVMEIYYIFSHLECSNIGYCRDWGYHACWLNDFEVPNNLGLSRIRAGYDI